jgi:replicative DNA helicase
LNTFDPVLETRVLKTVLEKKDPRFIVNLSSDWFGLPIAREIWERINSLKTNGKQIPSVITFASDPVLSENAQALLKGAITSFETNEVEAAMDQLNYFRQGRVLLASSKKVTELLVPQTGNIAEAKITLERALAALQSADLEDDFLSYGRNSEKTLELYDTVMSQTATERFIPIGFKFVDKKQGGLGRGRLYTIGAPSGGGKSTIVNQMCINTYQQFGYSCLYNSFEMGKEECLLRTQANITRIPNDRFQLNTLTAQEIIHSNKTLLKFMALGEKTGKTLEYHCPKRDINIAQLISIIEPMSFDVVVVDYINLMAHLNPKEGLWWNIGEAFRLMKRFAERTRCAVIMVVQIDEETKGIKYAKSIKHHSDGVWIWDWNDQIKEAGGLVEVEQVKLRNFAPEKFSLQAEFEYCAFSESFGTGASPTGVVPVKFLKPMTL